MVRKKGLGFDWKLHLENLPDLRKDSIFFHDSFFAWPWGHWTIRKTTVISLMTIINGSYFELNLIFRLKLRVLRLKWAATFLYAVCWGCFMAHFVADIHSFKMSHERTPANGVQERSRALNSIFVIFQVFSGHKKSKKYMNIKFFSKYFFLCQNTHKSSFLQPI